MAAPEESPPERRAGVATLVRDLLSFDRRAAVILVYVPVALTLMEYLFLSEARWRRPKPAWIREMLRDLGAQFPSVPPDLWQWLWWGAGCLTLLVLVPMALLRVAAGVGPRETGLRVKGTGRDALVYALLYAVFLPVVWLVSQRPDFLSTYPFYPRPPRGPGWDFVAFEAVYFLQFLSVEYFFRGFMTLGLKPALGRASVLVMLAPYCMIHFHKPMLEALGAIGAGLVLGALSWRTRTIVYGWFLHYAVALSMDLLSLSQSGRL